MAHPAFLEAQRAPAQSGVKPRQAGRSVRSQQTRPNPPSTRRRVAPTGTAVVLTPVKSITRGGAVHKYPTFETIAKLYASITAVQVLSSHLNS